MSHREEEDGGEEEKKSAFCSMSHLEEEGGGEGMDVPLLSDKADDDDDLGVGRRFWVELTKLWKVVGPAIVSKLVTYATFVITQAFAGHLGELQLAAISIVNNVILGFDQGLLLGMASALETSCGQAFGAKKYYMLGIYLQRSWVILFSCCILFIPVFIFAGPIFELLGQSADLSELVGSVAVWFLPVHFCFAFLFPLQRFLQTQIRNRVIMYVSVLALLVHVFVSWLFISKLNLGVYGCALTLSISWWLIGLGLFGYVVCGGCPNTWIGFSIEAFSGLWEYTNLSLASGVMICLENWYYRILLLMTGSFADAEVIVDALSICMTINAWEMTIHLAFFAGTGVRVSNELGAGNGRGAKFAAIVSVTTSLFIGTFFCLLILIFHNDFAAIFSDSESVIQEVDSLSTLLAFSILLNSVQPILSGVAVGSGRQKYVAYINLGCYYILGLPLGMLMGWVFNFGIKGIWAGMICGGTAMQTLIMIIFTVRCDWEKEAEKACSRVKRWSETVEPERN